MFQLKAILSLKRLLRKGASRANLATGRLSLSLLHLFIASCAPKSQLNWHGTWTLAGQKAAVVLMDAVCFHKVWKNVKGLPNMLRCRCCFSTQPAFYFLFFILFLNYVTGSCASRETDCQKEFHGQVCAWCSVHRLEAVHWMVGGGGREFPPFPLQPQFQLELRFLLPCADNRTGQMCFWMLLCSITAC